ncbi:YhbY family RNA-binding protein [Candidatus Pacearchaeota archaeon]|jgi:RNA-binding protein YhbY|nr:YhbY family RNA-binding protein [Candidatus Pacearchaeota archaeon]
MVFTEMQLGKNGITENFIQTMKNHFEKRETIRLSVLKSAGHEKEKVKKYSEEILDKLGKNYTAKIIGFKIILRKWRKARR